ncbi:PTS sugar transporter subunit IIA [Enterococcus florum]|uniref:PTS sugar transporter subunit IIA n=1 Tax=Enterococcus florum TaxID=2480627 RepID=A0A4P5PAI8_9ENTE|nr:PTS sugar transporter subunit IIA [Enterococcus florum]GCF94980.1 PTS sugar transporter subunit IIA [Enterococcus florum]
MSNSQLLAFDRELVKLDEYYQDQEELFSKISAWLQEKELVHEHYYEALKKREVEFPTGLHTKLYDVAIPHADPIHVKKPFIAFVRPANEIIFKEMATKQAEVRPKIILFLGLMKSEEQLSVLQKLMKLFSSEAFMSGCLQSDEDEKVFELLESAF